MQAMPTVPVNFVPAKGGEVISLGGITLRVMEDGSRTGIGRLDREPPVDSVLIAM